MHTQPSLPGPANQSSHLHFYQSEDSKGCREKIKTGMWKWQASNASQKAQRPMPVNLCLSSYSCRASFMKLCPHQLRAFPQSTMFTDSTMVTSEVIHYPSSNSVQFSCSVMSNSLWPHELQHVKLHCLSPPPGVYSTHVHWVGDAIKPSHPLSSPSPPAFNLSQHQGLFQWVSCSHQETKVFEFQL